MDQRRRLERIVRGFAGEAGRREPAELVVDQWQQFLGGAGLAAAGVCQEPCNVAHPGGLPSVP